MSNREVVCKRRPPAGNAYVVGTTTSNDFPTFHAVQDRFGSQPSFFPDAFVAKLSPGGSELVYSTYLGGHDEDSGHAIAAGAAYVTGATHSPNFPTRGPLQWAHAGAQDAFITKLTPDASELAYSAFLGGEGFDIGHDIVLSRAESGPFSRGRHVTYGHFAAIIIAVSPATEVLSGDVKSQAGRVGPRDCGYGLSRSFRKAMT